MMMDYPTDVCFCGCDMSDHSGTLPSFNDVVTCSEHGSHPLLSIATYVGLLTGEWDTIAPPLMRATDRWSLEV